jgi:hypothetical protein
VVASGVVGGGSTNRFPVLFEFPFHPLRLMTLIPGV